MKPAFRWTGAAVREALDSAPSGDELTFSGVSTDPRSLAEGDLFVALRGPRFDGHDFLEEAVSSGASGVVVEEGSEVPVRTAVFEVPDTLVALGRLARFRRRSLGWTVVGITGSAGKTTAKDLLRAALSRSFSVHATRGNRNNRVGLPLTLLEAPEESQVVVAEMGTNEPGEIEILTAIAEPDLALLTTVGEVHLEGLESREGVFLEKLALLSGLPEDGWAVVGDDPADLPVRARGVFSSTVVAGLSPAADPRYRPDELEMRSDGCYRFLWRGNSVGLLIPGLPAVRNAVLALAVADRLGVPSAKAAEAIGGVPAPPLRGETRHFGRLTVLVDCYNANPQNMRAALELLSAVPAEKGKVAVLGSMLELGAASESHHQEIIADAARRSFQLVLFVGEDFVRAATSLGEDVKPASRVRTVASTEEALNILEEELSGEELLLLKGSRGIALERLLPHLEEKWSSSTQHHGSGGEA